MRSYAFLLPALLAGPALGYDFWFLGMPQHFCKRGKEGDTSYNWRGSGKGCHNFDGEEGCTFSFVMRETLVTGEPLLTSRPCAKSYEYGPDNPAYINSLTFYRNRDAGGRGCLFYPAKNCTGHPTHVSAFEEDKNCFEFDHRIMSFMCL